MTASSTKAENNEKALGETQTLRAGCSKAEPKKIRPAADPLRGGSQNLISCRWSLPLPQTQFGADRCTQFRVIVVTDPQTNTHTHLQTRPITMHCTAASAQCNKDI